MLAISRVAARRAAFRRLPSAPSGLPTARCRLRPAFSTKVPRDKHHRRIVRGATAAAAFVASTGAAATTVALCSNDEHAVNWKLTLGLSAAAAVVAGGVAALFAGRTDESAQDAAAIGAVDGVAVSGCQILPMPPRGTAKNDESGQTIVLDNGCNTRVTWGVASAKGRRNYMEDEWCAGIIVPQIASDEQGDSSEGEDESKAEQNDASGATQAGNPLYIVGVFDGHGGGMCSKWASRNMLAEVTKGISRLSQVTAPQGVVETALAALEGQMVGKDAMTCGTTAIVVALTHEGKMVVANVGDSRAMICSGKGCDFRGDPNLVDAALRACAACALSEDHKPDGVEQARVEAAGGSVKFDGCYRVYLDAGAHKGKGGLAMSRALGDKFFKLKPYVRDESNPIVSPEPEFQSHQVTEKDSWCILASDGLWDVVTPDRICDILSKNVEGHKCDPQVVASELVNFALGQGSSDNVTVLALRFDHSSASEATGAADSTDAAESTTQE